MRKDHKISRACIVAIALAQLVSACGSADQKVLVDPRGANAAAPGGTFAPVVLRLPPKSAMPADARDLIDAYHVIAEPQISVPGFAPLSEVKPWDGASIVIRLRPGTAYVVRVQLGRLDVATNSLKQVFLATGDSGIAIPASSLVAGMQQTVNTELLEPSGQVVPLGDGPAVLPPNEPQVQPQAQPQPQVQPQPQAQPQGQGLTTGGSGGQSGAYEAGFSAGAKTSKFRVAAPSDIGPGKAYGLLVYLHGDGAGDYREDWLFQPMTKVAQQFGLMLVSVMSPDGGNQWYSDGNGHAQYLNDLIQNEIYMKYNIDTGKVFFTGASGGSEFLSGYFVGSFGHKYKGGAIPTCGGRPHYGEQFVGDAAFAQNFKLYYYTGTTDFLYDGVVEAVSYYKGKGMNVQSEYPQGVAHCKFDIPEVVERILPKLMGP